MFILERKAIPFPTNFNSIKSEISNIISNVKIDMANRSRMTYSMQSY